MTLLPLNGPTLGFLSFVAIICLFEEVSSEVLQDSATMPDNLMFEPGSAILFGHVMLGIKLGASHIQDLRPNPLSSFPEP